MTDIVDWLRGHEDWPDGTEAGMRVAANEIERQRTRVMNAAAFLDGLADRLEGHGNANRHTAAADCRAMASKLRGET